MRRNNEYNDKGLINFNHKQAKKQYEKESLNESDASSKEDSDNNDKSNNLIDFTNEFGRLRKSIKKQAR